jgi:hypothetical protein
MIKVTNQIREEEVIMLSKKNVSICGIIAFVLIFLATSASIYAADTTSQIITHVDEILNENPLKTGEKSQVIKIAEDDTVTLGIVRTIEGPGLKRHVHKAHDETISVVKGSGQIFVMINGSTLNREVFILTPWAQFILANLRAMIRLLSFQYSLRR